MSNLISSTTPPQQPEQLEVYDLEGELIGVQDRDSFYAEIKEEFENTGKITKQVRSVRVILMNSSGRIYLQKRSKNKAENPGLYDKSVGGHVAKGDTFSMTVIRECAEELGFPAAILPNILPDKEFERAIRVTDLSIVGIYRKIDKISRFESVRVDKHGNRFVQPYITEIYMGYFDGAIRFIDGESSGVEVFSLVELEEDIKNTPEKFTEDLKFMVKEYREYLQPIK